jgi:hypothetical protein
MKIINVLFKFEANFKQAQWTRGNVCAYSIGEKKVLHVSWVLAGIFRCGVCDRYW